MPRALVVVVDRTTRSRSLVSTTYPISTFPRGPRRLRSPRRRRRQLRWRTPGAPPPARAVAGADRAHRSGRARGAGEQCLRRPRRAQLRCGGQRGSRRRQPRPRSEQRPACHRGRFPALRRAKPAPQLRAGVRSSRPSPPPLGGPPPPRALFTPPPRRSRSRPNPFASRWTPTRPARSRTTATPRRRGGRRARKCMPLPRPSSPPRAEEALARPGGSAEPGARRGPYGGRPPRVRRDLSGPTPSAARREYADPPSTVSGRPRVACFGQRDAVLAAETDAHKQRQAELQAKLTELDAQLSQIQIEERQVTGELAEADTLLKRAEAHAGKRLELEMRAARSPQAHEGERPLRRTSRRGPGL